MEVQIKVVIPTKGRPDTICTPHYFANTIVCCSQSELPIYREHNPDFEYCAHPDSVIGIGPKRMWMYKKFGSLFMIDDDIKGLLRMTSKKGESAKITPELAYELIQNCGNIAKLCGAYLFGFNNWVRPEHYHGHEPYSMTGYINGAGLGMLEGADKLFFSDRIKTGHDYFVSALNAHFYRIAFIDRRFSLKQDSFANSIGGCADVRTKEVEENDFKVLEEYFGNAIRKKKGGNSLIKHEFSKSLIIPF